MNAKCMRKRSLFKAMQQAPADVSVEACSRRFPVARKRLALVQRAVYVRR